MVFTDVWEEFDGRTGWLHIFDALLKRSEYYEGTCASKKESHKQLQTVKNLTF